MILHPKFFDYVLSINPDVNFRQDVVVSVDGNGDATVEWNLSGKPPTDAEIDSTIIPVTIPKKSVEQRLADLEDKAKGN